MVCDLFLKCSGHLYCQNIKLSTEQGLSKVHLFRYTDGFINELASSMYFNPILIKSIFQQTQPVIWYENEPPGQVVILTAKDYDSTENGPPFTFALNESASFDIRSKFHIQGKP